jgi:hypothetical protein
MFRFTKVKNHRQLGDGVTIHQCRHSGESLAEAQDESRARSEALALSSKKGKAETLWVPAFAGMTISCVFLS